MMRKKIISLIVVLAFVCTALAFPVQADSNPLSTDEYLKTRGFPDSVLAEMDEDFKDYIAGTMDKDPSYAFANYETKDVGFSEPTTRISDVEMKFGVVTIKSGSTYQIYPNFIWNTVTRLKNDTFSFILPSGWKLVSGKRQLTIHYLDYSPKEWKTTIIDSPSKVLDGRGYAYTMGSSLLNRRTNYKGYAYFYATKSSASASNDIVLSYADDTSVLANFSYSIGIEGFSVTYRPTTSLREKADQFDLNPN